MSRIENYPNDNPIEGGEKLIGTDIKTGTRNFPISDLVNYFNSSGVLQTYGSTFVYHTTEEAFPDSAGEMKYISTGDTIDSVTAIQINKITDTGLEIQALVMGLGGSKIKIGATLELKNDYGIFSISGIDTSNPNYIEIALENPDVQGNILRQGTVAIFPVPLRGEEVITLAGTTDEVVVTRTAPTVDTISLDTAITAGKPNLVGTNTYTDTNIFNNLSTSHSIQVHTIAGVDDTDTYIDISNFLDNAIVTYAGGTPGTSLTTSAFEVNPLNNDVDFYIHKNVDGTALGYDSAAGTLTADVDIINLTAPSINFTSTNITGLPLIEYDNINDAPIGRSVPQDTFVLSGSRGNVVTSDANEMSVITIRDDFDSSSQPYIATFEEVAGSDQSRIPVTTAISTTDATGRIFTVTEGGITYTSICQLFISSIQVFAVRGTAIQNRTGNVSVSEVATDIASTTVSTTMNANVVNDFIVTGDQTAVVLDGDGIRFGDMQISALVEGTPTYDSGLDQTTLPLRGYSYGYGVTVGTTVRLSRASTLTAVVSPIATYSYDPDTADAIYANAITNQQFSNPGSNASTNLNDIGNTIATLNANITFDGVVFPSNTPIIPSGQTTSNKTTYSDVVDSSNWFIRNSGGVVQTFADGSNWNSLEGLTIVQYNTSSIENNTFTNLSETDENNYLIVILDNTTGASYNITDITRNDAVNGENTITLGTVNGFDLGTINGISANPSTVASLFYYAVPSSSIAIDLGTNTNISSSFTISNGFNNQEGIVNNNGTTAGGVSTTITVTDGDGMEVTSFTTSTALTTDSTIDAIGTQIAVAVNSNIETPINFFATWDLPTQTLVFRGASSGSANPWTITIDNNGQVGANAGNIAIASSVSTDIEGNVINIISFPDGTSQTTAVANVDILPLSNTFTQSNIFNSTSGVGSIQTNRISGIGDTDTYIDMRVNNTVSMSAGGTEFLKIDDSAGIELLNIESNLTRIRGTQGVSLNLTTDNENILSGDADGTTFNGGADDRNFEVRGTISNIGLNYDAGTHVLSTNATLDGMVGEEIGTWTPALGNLPSTAVPTGIAGFYNKIGSLVRVTGVFTLNDFTSNFGSRIDTSSLPFQPIFTSGVAFQGVAWNSNGRKYLAGAGGNNNGFNFGPTDLTTSTHIWGDLANGTTEFSVTYTTND